MKPTIEEEPSDAKNPFAGILGDREGDGEDGDEDGDDDSYDVTPEEVEAAGQVRSAMKGGDDEALAKALCTLVDLHGAKG